MDVVENVKILLTQQLTKSLGFIWESGEFLSVFISLLLLLLLLTTAVAVAALTYSTYIYLY